MELRQNNAPAWYILEDERQEFEKKLQDSTTDDDTRARIAHILKEARILNPENGTVGLKPGIVNIGKTIRYKVQSLLSENTFEWTFRIGGNESPIPWRIPHDTPFAAKFKGRKVDEDNSIFTVDKKVFKYSNLDLTSPEVAWMQSEPNDEVEIELISSEWIDE
jgi:hypothetical protein